MKKLLLLFILICFKLSLDAQIRYFNERYTYTQAHLYPVLINPAAAGMDEDHHVMFNYRNKWAAFDGSPKTITLSYDGQVAERLGFGALIVSDNYGELETTKGQLSFSYSIHSATNKIGFGLSTEYIQHKVAGSAISNPFLMTDDLTLLRRLDGNSFFDASFGITGMYNGKISYGLVFPGLISSSLDEEDINPENEFSYILNFGYRFESEKNDIIAEPSIFIKQLMGVPTYIDLNLRLGFLDEKLTGGLSYTLGADERVGFLVGTKINSLNFVYSYNVSRHEFQEYNNGSHEITIAFDISGNNTKEVGQMDDK